MNYLSAGLHKEGEVELYISLTRSDPENKTAGTKKAVTLHLVNGWPIDIASSVSGVHQSNSSAFLANLNSVAETVEKIIEAKVANQTSRMWELTAELTNFNSDKAKTAVLSHLVDGVKVTEAAKLNNYAQSNLSRNILKVEKKLEVVEKIHDFRFI